MKKTVVLIGFMGCGKSTAGKELAKALKYRFLDTDSYIEDHAKMSVAEIFAQYGEQYFRNLETETVKKLMEIAEETVVSTGGGLPLREENADILKKNGFVVYLRVKGSTVEERLKGDTARPLLQGDNVSGKIADLLEYRDPIYEYGAHMVLDVDEKTVEEIVEDIARNFKMMCEKDQENNNRD
ncbi:shikimate kinase [[Clostridium] polysaccharolyticum]|uniref:Shikimate kinase n=1 Tax=[Clostridium] polysaccharolyticum TaxID=29364 RepID=A0A1H9ZYI1_9FIRM|nr:shikimate kinase [[Clostridium] polysaccharolyticum]SES86883.1 shikimate kinase [[Clostridium] polysaccharolyticum]